MFQQLHTSEEIEEYLVEPNIHDEQHQELSGVLLVLIFSFFLTIGHALNIYWLLWWDTALALNLILHVVMVGLSAILVLLLRRAGSDSRLALLMLVTTPFMGVVGAAGTFLTSVLTIFYIRYSSSFDEWFASIFPKGTPTLPEEVMEGLEYGRDGNMYDYSVIPFLDILKIGNVAQKREALSRISSNFHPRFSPALKQALKDENSSIRVQAATTISKVENQFHKRLMKIEQLHRQFPGNVVIKKSLAEHYDHYSFTGVLDDQREQNNREKAEKLYREYLINRPEDIMVRLAIGRLLMRSGKLVEASNWLRECLSEGYVSDSIKVWYLECLYRQGDYIGLREAAATLAIDLSAYRSYQPEIIESIHLWTQAGSSMGQRGAVA
jgi:hypothetical protein